MGFTSIYLAYVGNFEIGPQTSGRPSGVPSGSLRIPLVHAWGEKSPWEGPWRGGPGAGARPLEASSGGRSWGLGGAFGPSGPQESPRAPLWIRMTSN